MRFNFNQIDQILPPIRQDRIYWVNGDQNFGFLKLDKNMVSLVLVGLV